VEDVSRYIPQPDDESATIWRYLDFTKFVALLETRALFFPRVSTLEDPFEGSFPVNQTVESRVRGAFAPGLVPDDTEIKLDPSILGIWKAMRSWASISCWHMAEYESAAMWRLYGPNGGAIAIRSRVSRLRHALPTISLPQGFGGKDYAFIGKVEYIDYATDRIPDGSFAAQFYRKQRSFEHERELRAMLLQFPLDEGGERPDYVRQPSDTGIAVPVDINVLIEGIAVAPQAPSWLLDVVTRVCKRYGVDATPTQSTMDATPLY
jgi:hypothetical protein